MLELVTKRINEMIADNDIKQGMKGKYLTVTKAEVTHTFAQTNSDPWSCYDGTQDADETDSDCGGSCLNGCSLLKKCNTQSDWVSGLYCTKNKCIDRSEDEIIG